MQEEEIDDDTDCKTTSTQYQSGLSKGIYYNLFVLKMPSEGDCACASQNMLQIRTHSYIKIFSLQY